VSSTLPYFRALKIGIFVTLLLGSELSLGYSVEAFNHLVKTEQSTSPEGILSALPKSLRSRYALLFKSRSLQGASFKDPRVILFGDDARFVITFNGSPDQKGYSEIEVMEFDDQSETFSFHEVSYSEVPGQRPKVEVSDTNPQKCLQCHGDPPRPIWDTSPSWPGAYGERYRNPLGKIEQEGLAEFLSIQPNHSRYRILLDTERFRLEFKEYRRTDRKFPEI